MLGWDWLHEGSEDGRATTDVSETVKELDINNFEITRFVEALFNLIGNLAIVLGDTDFRMQMRGLYTTEFCEDAGSFLVKWASLYEAE